MPELCVKLVEFMSKQQGMNRVQASTVRVKTSGAERSRSAKASFMPNFFPTFPRRYSTANNALLPLIEHTFYPVSTAPINNCNQINLKER